MSDIVLGSLPFTCSRTEKTYQVKMPIEEMKKYLEGLEQRAHAAKAVGDYITGLAVKPDCVIYYKGKAVIFANVHENSDAAIGRFVNEIAKKEIFQLAPAKPRKRKGAGAEEGAVATEEPEVELEVEE